MALQKKSDFEDAARFLGQVHYTLAAEKLEAKDTAGAMNGICQAHLAAFEVAYKAKPDNADNITNLIDVYERTNQSDKAESLTHDAVQRDPSNKLFRYAYGVFLLKKEKYPEAIEQFSKALEIDPAYADAKYNLGVAYLNWGVSLKAAGDKKTGSRQESHPLCKRGGDVQGEVQDSPCRTSRTVRNRGRMMQHSGHSSDASMRSST